MQDVPRSARAGYTSATYGDAFADVYDDWYEDVSEVTATVERITALAQGAAVLELGVGTGRLALPLAARQVPVTGIDASGAMLEVLRSKPGAAAITIVEGDMAGLAGLPHRAFAVVFVAFNTFFNLTSEAAQQQCLHRVSEVLNPGGHFVVEAFVPSDAPSGPEGRLDTRAVEVDRVHLTATWHDPHDQTVRGQHIELSETGTRLRPWLVRYASPDQLDALAHAAGLELVDRRADWNDEPFGPDSTRHVSFYRHRSTP